MIDRITDQAALNRQRETIPTIARVAANSGLKIFPVHGVVSDSVPGKGFVLCCHCMFSDRARGLIPRGTDCASPGKHPMTKHGVLDASCDREKIEAWWPLKADQFDFSGRANIGLATGTANKIVVLDVDYKHDGRASLDKLLEEPGLGGMLTASPTVITGNGLHIYFRLPDGIVIPNSAGKLGPGLDIRGEGGYVLFPGSIHVNGQVYQWRNSTTLVGASYFPRELMSRLMLDKPRQPKWKDVDLAVVADGVRNETITSLAGHLLVRKVDPKIALTLLSGFNKTFCQPPLDQQEVSAIVASIIMREAKKSGQQ